MATKREVVDIVFVHGAGEGSYEWTIPLVETLKENLDNNYTIHFLKMPDPVKGDYHEWADTVRHAVAPLTNEVILIGHSYGGSVLLRYLVENPVAEPFRGLFLLAMPYWSKGGWQVPDFQMPEDLTSAMNSVQDIFLYHCEDDEEVPFEHMQLYQKDLARAQFHKIKRGGHALKGTLPNIASRILSLQEKHTVHNHE